MLLQADVVLTSYSMLRFVVEETDRIEWHRVVFDEAHYMKSASTITTILCKRLLAKHRWCLTGTGRQRRGSWRHEQCLQVAADDDTPCHFAIGCGGGVMM